LLLREKHRTDDRLRRRLPGPSYLFASKPKRRVIRRSLSMAQKYHLISSVTCPWVQRSVILLRVKKVDFDVTYINLREKPDWFLKLSPHGKVPVLQVGDEVLFESNAIAEFLDETFEPRP
jgi:glutathionyl-hydroquinone reductase